MQSIFQYVTEQPFNITEEFLTGLCNVEVFFFLCFFFGNCLRLKLPNHS